MSFAESHLPLVVASDHAGLDLRLRIIGHLRERGSEVIDLGPADSQSVDYPDFAEKLAREIEQGRAAEGVLICGSGMGMAIAANRFTHIRAALCTHESLARYARWHNNANVLCLGERSFIVRRAFTAL